MVRTKIFSQKNHDLMRLVISGQTFYLENLWSKQTSILYEKLMPLPTQQGGLRPLRMMRVSFLSWKMS